MERTARRVLAVAVLLSLPRPAGAATLGTGPLPVFQTQNAVCTVTNLGTKPVKDVLVELVQFSAIGSGVVIETLGPNELAPLGVFAAQNTQGDALPLYHFCRFSAKGSGKSLRAEAIVLDGAAIVASEPAR